MIDLYKDNHVRAYYSTYDRFIQRQTCACMRVLVNFFFKNFSSETIDCIFIKFHRNVPYIEVKNFSLPKGTHPALISTYMFSNQFKLKQSQKRFLPFNFGRSLELLPKFY